MLRGPTWTGDRLKKLREWTNKATAALTGEGDSVRLMDVAGYVQENAFPESRVGGVQAAISRYVYGPIRKPGTAGFKRPRTNGMIRTARVRVFTCPHCQRETILGEG